MDDALAITNLLYRYAELVDAGDYDAVGRLFADGSYLLPGAEPLRGAALATVFKESVRSYDGRPSTKHVIANVMVEFDDADRARSRSYFVVLQATAELSLQAIMTGRYEDELVRSDGRWQFDRRIVHIDHIGDVSHHALPGRL